jgi:hypothetical protein
MNYLTALLLCGTALQAQPRTESSHQAESSRHTESTMILRLEAPPSTVLPLFGPVRESEWSPHWNPRFLYPTDGSQQAGSVFITGADLWVMTVFDKAALRVSYVITTPGESASQLDIVLKPLPGGATEATVTHRATWLDRAYERDVAESVRQFPLQRDHWEHAINTRLKELAK